MTRPRCPMMLTPTMLPGNWRIKQLLPLAMSILTVLCADLSAADGRTSEKSLRLVQRYTDALIEHGTDSYGHKHSPMLLSLMHRTKLEPFNSMPQAPSGIRPGDRVTTHGSNVNLDQNMYRVLYTLSEITGDSKYREAADAALSEFLAVSPSPETKLFAWGEHLCWDLEADTWGTHETKAIHEPKRPTVLFEKFYELNAESIINYCDGLWEHQLYSDENGRKDGNFSRHTAYDKHEPQRNYDFPKEGGYFIHDWARAYAKTNEPRFLDYIDVLASRYTQKVKKTKNNLIAFDSVRGFADTSASISLAFDCDRAARMITPGPVRDKLLWLANAIDEGLQSLPHEASGRGFAEYVTVEDDYKLYEHKQNGGYSVTWNMKYGRKTTAMVGVLCYRRYTQLSDGPTKSRYGELALQAAEKYLSTEPDMQERPWPVEIGIVMFLQFAAHELTGKQVYLNRARHFGALGMSNYWPDRSPLPKADPQCDHYENVTRADTLALALLKLHIIENSLPIRLDISDVDR